MYRVYTVTILREDRKKANVILNAHQWDFDEVREESERRRDGTELITYWIRPYCYEDYIATVNEFEEVGIRVM